MTILRVTIYVLCTVIRIFHAVLYLIFNHKVMSQILLSPSYRMVKKSPKVTQLLGSPGRSQNRVYCLSAIICGICQKLLKFAFHNIIGMLFVLMGKKKEKNETIIIYKMGHQKILLYFSPKNQSAIRHTFLDLKFMVIYIAYYVHTYMYKQTYYQDISNSLRIEGQIRHFRMKIHSAMLKCIIYLGSYSVVSIFQHALSDLTSLFTTRYHLNKQNSYLYSK